MAASDSSDTMDGMVEIKREEESAPAVPIYSRSYYSAWTADEVERACVILREDPPPPGRLGDRFDVILTPRETEFYIAKPRAVDPEQPKVVFPDLEE